MIRKYHSLFFFILPGLSVSIFITLVIFGSLNYNGGTFKNPDLEHYSFSQNYLSDLGRYSTYSGEKNTIPFYSFNIGLLILSCIFSLYFLYLPNLYDDNSKMLLLSRYGGLCGFLGSLCFAGVAFTPSDLLFNLHVFFANWLFRLLCGTILFLSISLLFKNKKSIMLSSLFLLIGFMVTSHIILSDFNFADYFIKSHMIKVLSQKAAVIALLLSMPLMIVYNSLRLKHPLKTMSILGL